MPTGCPQVILESGRSAREWVPLASRTSRVGKFLGGLGVLVVAVAATGCAAPEFTYVSDSSANTFFKVPFGWHRISDVSLAAQFHSPGSALGQASGTWDVAYDAAASPAAGHLFSPNATKPFAFAFVAPLNRAAANALSYNGLRDVLLPVTAAARTQAVQSSFPLTHFKLLRDTVITPGQGVHGVWDTFDYTYPGGIIDTFDQVALTNSNGTQLYVLMVHCVAACYSHNRAQLDTIMSSFTVRSP
jgi:hypothetical protein